MNGDGVAFVISIQEAAGTRYFQFDSASRLVCADTVPNGCALSRIRYDADGRRVMDDAPSGMEFTAFVEEGVRVERGFAIETRIEIRA